MKIKYIIIGEYGFAENRASIEHGDMTIDIKEELSQPLKQQVEDYYINAALQKLRSTSK